MSPQPWWRGLWNAAQTYFSPAQTSRIVRTGRTAAGVWINPDEALKNSTVWACVRYLTHAVAQTPWRVYRERPEGGRLLMATNPADYLLHRRPNPEMGSFTFRQAMLGMAMRWGNAYAEIERDNRGAVYALWPIHSDRVTVCRDETGALVYDVSNPRGGRVTLAAQDVFHVRGFGEGPVGYNVVEYAAQSIGWARATEIFGATFFGQGMNPSGVITMDKKLTPGGMDELRREAKRLYEGPGGEKTAIFDAGMKFEKLATNPNDAQFIETRQHQVDEICRWFGVPPHKVMHLLRATFSNIEHQSIEVVIDSVTPWVKIFEEEADYKLFGANRLGLYTRMDLRALMRGDSVARSNYYWKMWQMGAYSINKILDDEGENPIGPDGDARFVPANVVTLEQAIEGPMAAADDAAEPEDEPDEDDDTGDQPPTPDTPPDPARDNPSQSARRLNGRLAH